MNEPTHNPNSLLHVGCVLYYKTTRGPESLFLHNGPYSHVTAATTANCTVHVCKWTVIVVDTTARITFHCFAEGGLNTFCMCVFVTDKEWSEKRSGSAES